jgi:hypothetical protein
MKDFIRLKHSICEGAGYDSSLMNGLMPVVLDDSDLSCSVTGKAKTTKINEDKLRLLTGIHCFIAFLIFFKAE